MVLPDFEPSRGVLAAVATGEVKMEVFLPHPLIADCGGVDRRGLVVETWERGRETADAEELEGLLSISVQKKG